MSITVYQQNNTGGTGQNRHEVTNYGLLGNFDCSVVGCFRFRHDDAVTNSGDAAGFHNERVAVIGDDAGVCGALGDGNSGSFFRCSGVV